MNTKFFFYAAIFALTFAACDDKDTTGPEIKLIQPEMPLGGELTFTRGDAITIEFTLADPSGINAYKIDIHYAGGEHAHTHALGATPAHEDGEEEHEGEEPWEFLETCTDKRGEPSAQVKLSPTIPDNAQEGDYHLGILATDMAGNESQVYIDFEIEE